MKPTPFQYFAQNDAVFFMDTLKNGFPCIFDVSRRHESLFLVTKGTLLYEKDGEQTMVEKGHVGYISKGSKDTASAYQCDEVSYVAVDFSHTVEEEALHATLPFPTLVSQGMGGQYEKLFYRALHAFSHKQPGYQPICNGILLQIIGHLYEEYTLSEGNRKKMMQLKNAMKHLDMHFGDTDFKIRDLAKLCDMSDKNFRKIFFEVYGKMPYAYLQEYRIGKAEILLANTYKPISEIAIQCGFGDVYSFSHCFKNHTGLSPLQYRKKN